MRGLAGLPAGALALIHCTSAPGPISDPGVATFVSRAPSPAPDGSAFPPLTIGSGPAPTPNPPIPSPPWPPRWDADIPDVACSPTASDSSADGGGGCDFPPSQCEPVAEAGTEYARSNWLTYFTNAACVDGSCRWETKHLYCANGCVDGRCASIIGTTTAVP